MPIFAFTDIEGSTGLWERHRGAMGPVIARHYAILEDSLARHGGRVVKKTGDGVFAIFPDEDGSAPSAALACALELQRRFQDEPWPPEVGELRVRMAFHCGEAEEMAGDYYGPTANRTARFMGLGWGGQVLVSDELRRRAVLPEGAAWVDLGVHQVKDLPEPQHVHGLLHPSLRLREFPPLKSLSNRPHNLPEQLEPLVGRAQELRRLAGLWGTPQGRLVTLLGLGGVGKTRLALQAALEALPAFKHGATRVGLGGLEPQGLAERIAGALKLALYRQEPPREQLLGYLKDRQLLLLLDPCERLGGGAALLGELLQACPGLAVLACSRRRLGLRGETVLELRGLDHPAEPGEGVTGSGCARLFTRAAQAVQPGWRLEPADQADFLRLCRALRGLPLGLELAAGWLRTAPLKVLAERVEKDPRFLSSTRPDLAEEHRSLKALFESAWAALGPEEQRGLAGLTVFAGSAGLAAAQRVAGVGPEVLAALAGQGLLEQAGPGRFSLPPLARPFAAMKLDADPAARGAVLDQHARHYLRLLKEREPALAGLGQAKAVAELRPDLANLARAWDRGLAQGWARELGQAGRAAGLLLPLLGLSREWEPRLERALQLLEQHAQGGAALQEDTLQGQAGLLFALAECAYALGRAGQARERMERSLGTCRRAGLRAAGAWALLRLALYLGPEDARRVPAVQEALGHFDATGDAVGLAAARRVLGQLHCLQGRAAEGRPLLEQALQDLRRQGHAREEAWCLNALGQADLDAGDLSGGLQRLERARGIFLELGDLEAAAWTLLRLAQGARARANAEGAQAAYEDALALFGRLRHVRGRALALRGLCELQVALGEHAAALQGVARAVAEAQAAGDAAGLAGALAQKGQLLAGQGQGDAALEALQAAQEAWAKAGSAMGQALAEEARAGVLLGLGKPQAARAALEAALERFVQAGSRAGEARLCVRLGELDAAEERPQGGEARFRQALRLSRDKPGDYTLGALAGLAGAWLKQGRKLEALHLVLVAERALAERLLPPSEPEFHAALAGRVEALLGQLGSKLLVTVIEEARKKLAKLEARTLLRECVEKNAG